MINKVNQQLIQRPLTWLITGVAGFIGSNLLEALLRLDQRVIGLDNFASGTRQNLCEVSGLVGPERWANFHFLEGDVCSQETCRQACEGVDYLLHHAALASVQQSISDPIAVNAANVSGCLNMLVAARDAKVKRVIYAASSSTYGDQPDGLKVEDTIGRPLSPYAVTKYVNELYADVFWRCFGLETIGLRYFNIFGPRQDQNGAYAAVIPKWIATMIKDDQVVIYGDGETTRDFCYIDNAVQANLLAATAQNPEAVNQIYNVAVGESCTLNKLYSEIRALLQPDFPHLRKATAEYRNFRVGDVRHSLANIGKAAVLLNYAPTYRLRDGLERTITSYMKKAT